MQPRGPTVLVGPADSYLRRTGITEEEVGEGIAGPLPVEREHSSRHVRVHGIEPQMKEICADLHTMVAAIEQDILVQFETAVLA